VSAMSQNLTNMVGGSDPDPHMASANLKAANTPCRNRTRTCSRVKLIGCANDVLLSRDGYKQLPRTTPPTSSPNWIVTKLHPTQSTLDDVSSLADEAEAIDGRLLFDPDGTVRYFGETSGATFLEYLKHFMLTLVPFTCQPDSGDGSSFVASIGQYQTFDSRPLPNPDVNPLWLPSPDEMTSMLAELRYYLQDGSGNFPSGGIHWQVPLASSYNKTNPHIREGGVILAAYHSRCPARLP
jgi:hypothetical protein